MSNGATTARVLGTISLIGDRPVKLNSPKLQSTEPGTDNDLIWLVATYCFDLQRRMEYVFKAAEDFAIHADPDLAREIQADSRSLNEEGLSWKQRAQRAEAIMIRLYNEVETRHETLLRDVAEGGPQSSKVKY